MNRLLSDEQFQRAREEYANGILSAELHAWIVQLVSVVSRTGGLAPPPTINGSWDDPDAITETTQAWLEEKLLRGGLRKAFDAAALPAVFVRYLESSLRRWLIDNNRGATGPRLLNRAAEYITKSDDYTTVHDASAIADRWWARAEWIEPVLTPLPEHVVAREVWALGEFDIKTFATGGRNDPVLGKADLERLIDGLFERIREALSGRHLDASLRTRFAFAYAEGLADEAELELIATAEDPGDMLEIRELARATVAALSERELLILLHTGTLEEFAAARGFGKSTAHNAFKSAITTVAEIAGTADRTRAVLEKVREMTSEVGAP